MCAVKVLGMIFLAIYLIFTGAITMFEATPGMFAKIILDLLAIASGVLILISAGRCGSHKED